MTLDDVKQFLADNSDDAGVKEFLIETTEKQLETEEGKRLFQPRLDRYHAKSLESWKENNLDKIVEEKLKELNPEETEEQRKIRELEERLNQAEREKTRQSLLNDVTKKLSDEGLPTHLAGLLIHEDEEKLTTNLETYKQAIETVKENVQKELLKEHGRNIKTGVANTDKEDKAPIGVYSKDENSLTSKAQEKFFGNK